MTEDRDQVAPIANPHGLSIEWLRVQPGNAIGPFRLAEKQALIVFRGEAAVTLNQEQDVTLPLRSQETVSVPGNAWRSIAAAGDEPAEIAVITAGDARKRITWAPNLVAAAAEADVGIDPNGYIAPARLLPPAA